jgi:Arc/MetJ family transcription regulator
MPNRKLRRAQPLNPVNRNVRVDDELLRRAGRVLGTQSPAETVTAALDLIVFRDEVSRGIRRMAGTHSMRDIYEADS